MKIVIDTEKCEGHNRCYGIVPELIEVDDFGYASAAGDGTIPPELLDKAHLAVDNCPEYAITVEAGDGEAAGAGDGEAAGAGDGEAAGAGDGEAAAPAGDEG